MTLLDPGHNATADTQSRPAEVDPSAPDGQSAGDTRRTAAVGCTPSAEPGQLDRDARWKPAGSAPSRPDAPTTRTTPENLAARRADADAELAIYADAVDDFERVRIATENRVRALRQVKGLADHPEEERLTGIVEGLAALEKQCVRNLERAMRRHPLGPWVKRTVGVGEKQGARLLAAIGDPYWNATADQPRTVSQLWAYCGYHVVSRNPDQGRHDAQAGNVGVAARRRRGQRINWSPTAKMRAHLVAKSCMRQRHSPYRPVYDRTKAHYAGGLGPDGKPLTAGHIEARALRAVAKAVLRDLWIEARALHEATIRKAEIDNG